MATTQADELVRSVSHQQSSPVRVFRSLYLTIRARCARNGAPLGHSSERCDAETRSYDLEGCLLGSRRSFELLEEIRRELGRGTRRLIIDLSSVERVDSAGIGILAAVMWEAAESGAALVLVSPPEKATCQLGLAFELEGVEQADSLSEAYYRLGVKDSS